MKKLEIPFGGIEEIYWFFPLLFLSTSILFSVMQAIIRDIQTKTTVAEYPADQVKLARRKAERMNQAHGAVRYVVTFN